jgi:putative tricarboxylic transport membrane protein
MRQHDNFKKEYKMRRSDLISSVFFSLCGLFIIAGSLGLTIGRLGEPGPGFLPLIVGALLVLMSIVLFVTALRRTTAEQGVAGMGRKERVKVLTTSLSLVLYAVALQPLGFVPVTLLLLVFLFKAIGELGWKVSLAGPLLTTFFFYLLFKVWLEVPFSMGPSGMG